MGIVRAAFDSARGVLSDQWFDVVEPKNINDQTLFSRGVKVTKGKDKDMSTNTVITDGSVIRVPENTMMLLVDGGKIIDYSAEPGYYKVENSAAPSLFNGDMDGVVLDTYERFKFGGQPSQKQEVFFINLIEITGIRFGTTTPIQYYDDFYNAEMFLRMHGTYSVKVADPLLFYKNVVSKSADGFYVTDFYDQYHNEFIVALSSSVSKYSVDGERISHLASKGTELSSMMKEFLAEKWRDLRGIDVISVAVANLSYDDKSQKIINSRNRGASLGGAVKALFGASSGSSAIKRAKEDVQLEKILSKVGTKWSCPKCKTKNTGKFCSNCGEKAATVGRKYKPCTKCAASVDVTDIVPKFCSECGEPFEG